MAFSHIKFHEQAGRNGPTTGLSIKGYWVPKYLFVLMWDRATKSLPALDWSKKQSVVTIFGDFHLWVSYRVGTRIALGRCLRYFAGQDMLPIREANPGKKGPRRYIRN